MTKSKPLRIAMELLMGLEDLRTEAYDDGSGVWTIGYGHTAGVKQGMVIDKQMALELLEIDATNAFDAVAKCMTNRQLTRLGSMETAALISFCFSIGETRFASSTLVKCLHEGKYELAPEQMQRWNKVDGKVWPGLVTRRYREAMLWLGCPTLPKCTK